MLRAVIDTNTWVSGLIWAGAPRRLIEAALNGDVLSLTSRTLSLEFERVLGYPRIEKALLKRGLSRDDLAGQFAFLNQVVEVVPLALPVSRDPDDDAVLACALAARADFIVSGDQDLLVLGQWAGIPILSAVQTLDLLEV
ncbi:MAG: putative toxin-antitoxin system toxin component, PIN family [Polaromonas sp.]